MLTEGVDIPKTQTVFLVRPTRSDALLSQMIGRALRGPRAGGTREAHLVTFVDTWKQFHPLDGEYVPGLGEIEEEETQKALPANLVPIALELVSAAYELVRSNVRGDFLTNYACLLHSWYVWEEELENDVRRRSIMVFENQVDGFERLEQDYRLDPEKIPADLRDDLARDLVRRYFAGSTQNPLPRWLDVSALLTAWRKDLSVESYTFEEKREFDPAHLARSIRERNLGEKDREEEIKSIWNRNGACRLCYHENIKAFFEDINHELEELRELQTPPPPPKLPPTILKPWHKGEESYHQGEIRDAVITQPRNFPHGVPPIGDIRYTERSPEEEVGLLPAFGSRGADQPRSEFPGCSPVRPGVPRVP